MLRANTLQQEIVIFFAAKDLTRTEELALFVPQVMLPLLQNPTIVNVSVGHSTITETLGKRVLGSRGK